MELMTKRHDEIKNNSMARNLTKYNTKAIKKENAFNKTNLLSLLG